MRDLAVRAVRHKNADYVEVRLEERHASQIVFRNGILEGADSKRTTGGFIRVLAGGAWGVAAVNDLGKLEPTIEGAIQDAHKKRAERAPWHERHPVIDEAAPANNPAHIKQGQKIDLARHYDTLVSKYDPSILATLTLYQDLWSRKTLVTSEGTIIEQEYTDATFLIGVMAQKGNEACQMQRVLGGANGFGSLHGLEDTVKSIASQAVIFAGAKPVKNGRYPVVFAPGLGGVFIHETLGHISEGDVVHSPDLEAYLRPGRVLGGPMLNVVDSPLVEGLRGSYRYDDEGFPAQETHIMKQGRFLGRLHTRETAAKMGQNPTGNARALDFRFPPQVRMSNTCILAGDSCFETMIRDIDEGIYVADWFWAKTKEKQFSFVVNEAYMIRDGAIAEPVQGAVLNGDIFEVLSRIDAIGNDVTWWNGNCGKNRQYPLPVCVGSPHIRVQDMWVGDSSE